MSVNGTKHEVIEKGAVIESRSECPLCKSTFLKSHLCETCRQQKGILDEHNLMIVPNGISTFLLRGIEDGDIILLQYDDAAEVKTVFDYEESAKTIARLTAEYSGKKLRFIILKKGLEIKHIPKEMFLKLGLKRIEPADSKNVNIG